MDRCAGVDVVILAAGQGRRMGVVEHKALLPIIDGQGTLARLLGQLSTAPVRQVTVVTGHRHAAVEAVVRARLPRAWCVYNPHFAEGEMLQSLACAFAVEAQGADCWVLLADTVYTDATLDTLWATPPGGVALAVAPRDPAADREIAVELRGGAVVALAGEAPHAAWRMAHAVRWPASLRPRLRAAAQAGLRFQWQLIAALLREGLPERGTAIHAILTPPDGAFDIDSEADLARVPSIPS